MTSVLEYGRKVAEWHNARSRLTFSSSSHATTLAAGSRFAISLARFGPLTTPIRPGPASAPSAMTSLIRLSDPSSTPFIKDTRSALRGMMSTHSLRFCRKVCDGTANTTNSAPCSVRSGGLLRVHALWARPEHRSTYSRPDRSNGPWNGDMNLDQPGQEN